jgi:hypothetical protein
MAAFIRAQADQGREIMTTRRQIAVGLAALCGTLALVGLIETALAITGIPVTATFRDAPGDQIASDGRGPYVNGVENVKAILDGRGDFDLDTSVGGLKPIRALSLDFGQPASPPLPGCSPPFATPTLVDVYLSTGVGGLPAMAVGSSVASSLAVHFGFGGTGWFVEFGMVPGTSTVTVTHVTSNTWTIEAASTAIAELQKATTTKGKIVTTDCGTFLMPFEVTVTE